MHSAQELYQHHSLDLPYLPKFLFSTLFGGQIENTMNEEYWLCVYQIPFVVLLGSLEFPVHLVG